MRKALAILTPTVLILCACESNQPTSRVDQPYRPLERVDTTPIAPAGSTSSDYTWDRYAAPTETVADTPRTTRYSAVAASDEEPLVPAETAPEPTGRVHVVKKGDTLYALARSYYGDQGKWKDIYEANRARIPNAHKISIGLKLIIP